jgi:hypothetical protein
MYEVNVVVFDTYLDGDWKAPRSHEDARYILLNFVVGSKVLSVEPRGHRGAHQDQLQLGKQVHHSLCQPADNVAVDRPLVHFVDD